MGGGGNDELRCDSIFSGTGDALGECNGEDDRTGTQADGNC